MSNASYLLARETKGMSVETRRRIAASAPVIVPHF